MDGLAWAAVGAVIAAITMSIGFATFWMNISQRITEAKSMAETAKSEADSAGMRAVQANLKIDTLTNAVSDFKVHAERYFVNHDDLKQFSAHHDAQFNDLKSDLKDIKHQLTRLVETRVVQPPVNA